MVDIFDFATPFSDLRDKAVGGDEKAAMELFAKLQQAISDSKLHPNAQLVLGELIENVAKSSSTKNRVLGVSPKKRERAIRDYLLRIYVGEAAALGFKKELDYEANAYEWAAEKFNNKFGSNVTPSQAKTAGSTDSIATLQSMLTLSALVSYFRQRGESIEDAIDSTVSTVCRVKPTHFTRNAVRNALRFCQNPDQDIVTTFARRYGLID